MASNSLQTSRRRSFNLPSFRRLSAGERQEAARNAGSGAEEEEAAAARLQKAAAWQWYTRGVGENVQVPAPTSRPPLGNSRAPGARLDDKNGVMQKKTVEPPLADCPRAPSRFKAEASSASLGAQRPTLSAPSGGPSTPLYDQFELSSLRTQIADYVQRLQHQPTKDKEQSPAAAEHPPMLRPSAPSVVSSDHHQRSKASPAGNSSNDHQRLSTSAVPAASTSTTPLHIRPFSALHRLFRKVVFGSATSTKSRKNPPQTINFSPPTSVHEPAVLPEEEEDNIGLTESTQLYHYHHYIHHHHHHYHYAESPQEQANMLIRSRRRHSESSNSCRPVPSPWLEEEFGEEEDEAEKSPMKAYLARRRRHSDSFSGHLQPKKANFDEDKGIKADPGSRMQFSRPDCRRHYTSERFSPNKISTMVSEELAQSVAEWREELDVGIAGMKGRRRHSTELCREEAPNLQKTGGKIQGGTYKLGGGGAASGETPAILPAVRARRHSESSKLRPVGIQQQEMEKHTPSPGRSFWQSPSARYHANVQEHHIGVPAAATGSHLHAALPPRHP